jgi:glycosyltransferase involved in cell wall biosynthesis
MRTMKKIAIYSGVIPSTTFIERLIEGIAIDNKVLLFGYQENKKKYSKNIAVYSYSNRFRKLFILIKYTILLFLFQNKEKQKIDKIIKEKQARNNLNKIKYYPVLYHKPDIFHLQWAKSVEDWIWVQEFGIKLIVSLRGAHINYTPITDASVKQSYDKHFPAVDGFHAVSKAIAQETLKYNAPKEKIKVIYSGLNLDKFKLNKNDKENHNQFRIISIGRNHWKKGYTYALDVCKLLKESKINFSYEIIGIDKNAEELIFQVNQLELSNEVTFHPKMSFDKIKDKICSSSIVLLPSIEEGIANVVLESMALGTIVVTSNCGGMNEVVKDSYNGFIFPSRDVNSMKEAIVKAINLSQQERLKMVQNARKTIEEQHNENIMIERFKQLYQSVL